MDGLKRFVLAVAVWHAVVMPALALHEFGHAVAMWLCGLTVTKFQFGIGPVLWQHVFSGGFILEFRPIMLMAATHGGDTGPVLMADLPYAAKMFIYLAGMGVNALTFAAGMCALAFAGAYEPMHAGRAWYARLPRSAAVVVSCVTEALVSWVLFMPRLIANAVREACGGEPRQVFGFGRMGDIDAKKVKSKPLAFAVGAFAVIGMVSIQLAQFNLLPIPGIDGMRALLLTVEAIGGAAVAAWVAKWLSLSFFGLMGVCLIAALVHKRRKDRVRKAEQEARWAALIAETERRIAERMAAAEAVSDGSKAE